MVLRIRRGQRVHGADPPRCDLAYSRGVTSPHPADYPGSSLGLPADGVGSLASWRGRLTALFIDWSASMVVAMGLFGTAVLTGSGWRTWMPMTVFFVEKALLTALTGSSFGQLITGVGVSTLSGRPIDPVRAVARTALVCVVVPAVIIGPDRRGLNDLLLNTVAVKKR